MLEGPRRLFALVTGRIPRPGKVGRKDYEYKRKGTAVAFCAVEPKRGKHFVKVSKHRKAPDFAEFLRNLGQSYPNARKIHLVRDNLNTHCLKSLTDHLGPKRGANLWSRFEVHYTPKHASWLNQAETQISMFSRECLGKDRIASVATLKKRAGAWAARANQEQRRINWRFTREKVSGLVGELLLKLGTRLHRDHLLFTLQQDPNSGFKPFQVKSPIAGDVIPGKPVMLLHGFALDSRQWLPLIAPLMHLYQFILPDFRGHANSPIGPFHRSRILETLIPECSVRRVHRKRYETTDCNRSDRQRRSQQREQVSS